MRIPHGIICYFQFDAAANINRGERQWKFLECYAVDQDGYPRTAPKNGPSGEEGYRFWVNEENSGGRAVTYWCVESGVSLLEIILSDRPKWLAQDFEDRMIKSPNWYKFFEDGFTLWAGSAREVERFLEGKHE